MRLAWLTACIVISVFTLGSIIIVKMAYAYVPVVRCCDIREGCAVSCEDWTKYSHEVVLPANAVQYKTCKISAETEDQGKVCATPATQPGGVNGTGVLCGIDKVWNQLGCTGKCIKTTNKTDLYGCTPDDQGNWCGQWAIISEPSTPYDGSLLSFADR
jgi:hypothetical protein